MGERARHLGANVATRTNQAMSIPFRRELHARRRQSVAPIPRVQNSNAPPTTPVVEMCVRDQGQSVATQGLLPVSPVHPGIPAVVTPAKPREAGVAGAGV